MLTHLRPVRRLQNPSFRPSSFRTNRRPSGEGSGYTKNSAARLPIGSRGAAGTKTNFDPHTYTVHIYLIHTATRTDNKHIGKKQWCQYNYNVASGNGETAGPGGETGGKMQGQRIGTIRSANNNPHVPRRNSASGVEREGPTRKNHGHEDRVHLTNRLPPGWIRTFQLSDASRQDGNRRYKAISAWSTV